MSKFCKQCGTQLKDEAQFCPKCGCEQGAVKTQNYMGGNTNFNSSTGKSYSSGNETIVIVAVAILTILLGVFFIVFKGDINEVKSALHMETKNETVVEEAAPAPVTDQGGVTKEKIAEFVNRKDSLDVEIGAVAAEINSYLGTHRDFRGKDADSIINKAKETLTKVENTKNEVQHAKFSQEDEAVKQALLNVIDCEVGRIRGLYKGVLDSRNNGDYQIGFKEGTAAAYKYDDENAKLKALYTK
ncbi:MAG: zinc-ribbon domain-containing protein [Anaerovibrio sp.]|uniref:zinc-ribbon domain-containing protein n=1 Tax=Anaerovibrio sp. TaxID=1872532 RepID=UPI0025EDC2FD|nr:zinc ribbon domain-containing protein [Anaerovibrio sp.]MCR5175762.1 zinc-ribbon domain-containing protein [Anaerovibrio sp.]